MMHGFVAMLLRWAGLTGAALALTLGFAGAAEARWLRAESPRFIVYSDGDERALREYVRKLEVFDRLLRHQTGLPLDPGPPRKLPIYLVRNHAQLEIVRPGLNANIAGFYMASGEDIYALGIRSRESDDVLLHEYTHHFMLANFSYAYPAWLVEGFAEYFMTVDIDGSRVTVGEHNRGRTQALEYGSWMPLSELLTRRPLEVEGRSRDTYYPLAWLLTHWFVADEQRRPMLLQYMREVGAGGDPVTAMERAAGMSLESLQQTLQSYRRGGLPYVAGAAQRFGEFPVTVTQLGPVADDLLLLSLRLKAGVADEHRATTVEAVRRAAARHGDDPFARLTLGHAELHFGDAVAGEAILARLLEREPENVEALQLMASARMAAAEAGDADVRALLNQARGFLARAYRADPDNFVTLYMLGRSRNVAPDYPDENDMNTWLLAYDLAPQLGHVRLGAADALMRLDRYEEAITLLGPVANNPHGGEGAEAARAMLERARAGLGD